MYEELKRNYDALQKKRDTELAELRRLYSMLLARNGAQQAGVAPEKYAGAKERAEVRSVLDAFQIPTPGRICLTLCGAKCSPNRIAW